MKVYLVNPPYKKGYIRSARWGRLAFAGSNWYPIFLGYAAGLLEKYGHEVRLKDALVDDWSIEQTVGDIVSFKPDITAVYFSEPSFGSDYRLVREIKKKISSRVVFVGPWCFWDPEKILDKAPEVDYIIKREFELPLLKLAEGAKIKEIPDLIWRDGGKTVQNAAGEFMDSGFLDELPFVTDVYRRHLNIRKYIQSSLRHPFVDLFSARGCSWGKCTFCLWPHTIFSGLPYRVRKIGNVIEELKFVRRYLPHVKEVFFQDDTMPPSRARLISEAILKNKIKITWSCYAKPVFDFETLKLMKSAGARCLHVGYESGVQGILDETRKGQTIEQMEKFTRYARKLNFVIHSDFMLGLPGENLQTMKKTIEWAKKLPLTDYQFVVPQPEAGSPMYEWLSKKGYIQNGKVNYPHLSQDTITKWRLKAYKDVYLSPAYIVKLARWTRDYGELLRILRMGFKGLPNMLFRREEE